MMRDEAIKILSRIWGGNPQHDLANRYADAFVALGILKLEEPKSARELAKELLAARLTETGCNFPALEAEAILCRLTASNLKVVEK